MEERQNIKLNFTNKNIEYFICIIHMHASGITRKEYTNVSHGRIIHILFYEQAACRRGTKWKKVISVGNIAMWLYYSLAGSVTTSLEFEEQRQKEIENSFQCLPCDTLQSP